MSMEAPHLQFTLRSWDMKQSPAASVELLLAVVLIASTTMSPADVEMAKNRIVKEGLKIYITGSMDTEMLTAMRIALFRTEEEREHYRTRATHFENELRKAEARVTHLEEELEKKRKIFKALERGLRP